jgi:hypothetical protein
MLLIASYIYIHVTLYVGLSPIIARKLDREPSARPFGTYYLHMRSVKEGLYRLVSEDLSPNFKVGKSQTTNHDPPPSL